MYVTLGTYTSCVVVCLTRNAEQCWYLGLKILFDFTLLTQNTLTEHTSNIYVTGFKYRLNLKTKGSTEFITPKALGCSARA